MPLINPTAFSDLLTALFTQSLFRTAHKFCFMKNKLLLAAVFAAAFGATTLAQDTIPTLTIDSTLYVGDSASFDKNVRVGNKMTVEGLTILKDNTLINGDLTVTGSIFYPNAPSALTLTHKDVFVFNPVSQKIEVATLSDMQDHLYNMDCSSNSPTWTNAPNKIFVDCPDVRVGIGTDAPLASLHVAGNGLFQGTLQTGNIGLGIAPSTFSRMKIKSGNYAAGLEVDNTGNTSQFNKLVFLQFDNPSTEIIKVVNTSTGHVPLFMEANGELTIHNGTRETFKLTENGHVYTRKLIINNQNNWPDFVFKPTYHLRPLAEVKLFIDQNGHLPEVPAAAAVEAAGVDIGEMNRILLLKVEELTLYILQQEERIKALEAVKQ